MFEILRNRFLRSAMGAIVASALILGTSPAAMQAEGGLGDDEVCGTGTYLGRIVTGGGHFVGEQITVGAFTIEVTSIKVSGEITGFSVVSGTYDYIVIHAGDGQVTFTDPTGPFEHGLSFVAFCSTGQVDNTPTSTPTEPVGGVTEVPPTDTPTNTPTETPTEPVGGETEVPTTAPTMTATEDVPVGGVTEEPTEELDDVAELPSTGTFAVGSDSGAGTILLLTLIGIMALGVGWRVRAYGQPTR